MDQSVDAVPQGVCLSSTPETEPPKIDKPGDVSKHQESSTQDLEEDEVSFQLADAPSSPALSETVQTASKNLVPMYPDRESSPPDEAEKPVESIPDAEVIKTPPPDSPGSIEELTPDAQDDLDEDNISELQEQPTSRKYPINLLIVLTIH